MSGVELIFGATLGAIPILLEAYDGYRKLSKAFATFRYGSREMMRLDASLCAKKALFRSNVAALLRVITNDPDKASRLLSEDADWSNISIAEGCRLRIDILQDSFRSWKGILDQMYDCLQCICAETEEFRIISSPNSSEVSGLLPLQVFP